MKKVIYFFLLIILTVSCDDLFTLEVPNRNTPGIEQVLNDPSAYPGVLAGAYQDWYLNSVDWQDKYTNMATNCDAYVGPGEGYTYYATYEKPRIDNGGPGGFHQNIWAFLYKDIGAVRNILYMTDVVGKQYKVEDADRSYIIQANACFLLGVLHAELSLLYDKAFIITENTDIGAITSEDLVDAVQVRDVAMDYFDRCINLCTSNSFTNVPGMFPGNILLANNNELRQFASFMAARTLAYFPRYSDETPSVDWNRVRNYAQNGITKDWFVTLPNPGWNTLTLPNWCYFDPLNTRSIWYRVNHRIINMMADPNEKSKAPWPTPSTWVSTDIQPEAALSSDDRLASDFVFLDRLTSNDITFVTRPRYSQYAINRFSEVGESVDNNTGDTYFFVKAESDLLYAEALIRSNGDKALAANLINNTRVDRGGLSAASANDSDLLQKLFYEKIVECSFTVYATPFFDRRRCDINDFKLTSGSFRELPVPYRELEIWKLLETYDNRKPSFGGTTATTDNIVF